MGADAEAPVEEGGEEYIDRNIEPCSQGSDQGALGQEGEVIAAC